MPALLPTSLSIVDLEKLLDEVRQRPSPPKEETLFSIAGRGHYENPISDLLAFFMCPDGQHGLGALFLRAFFACLAQSRASEEPKSACGEPDLGGPVKVLREVETTERLRIDLLVRGGNWVLVIENKIRHWLANDLRAYEDHARKWGGSNGRSYHFVVLSPEGLKPEGCPEWQSVSYQHLCSKLREELGNTFFAAPLSKWQVFAREFIVHLENETHQFGATMSDLQLDLVERRMRDMQEAKELLDTYHNKFLADELTECMRKAVPGRSFTFKVDWRWALLCDDDPSRNLWRIAFRTPALQDEGTKDMFEVRVWLREPLTEAQERDAFLQNGMDRDSPESGGQWWHSLYASRAPAVETLGRVAKKLFEIWEHSAQNLPSPTPPLPS